MANNNYANQNPPLDQMMQSPRPGMVYNNNNVRPANMRPLMNGNQQIPVNPALVQYYSSQNLAMFGRGGMARPIGMNPQQMQMQLMSIRGAIPPQFLNAMQGSMNGQSFQGQQSMPNMGLMQHPAIVTQNQQLNQAKPNPQPQMPPQQTPKGPPSLITNQSNPPSEQQPTPAAQNPSTIPTPVPVPVQAQVPTLAQVVPQVLPQMVNPLTLGKSNAFENEGNLSFFEAEHYFRTCLDSFSEEGENLATASYWNTFVENHFSPDSFIIMKYDTGKPGVPTYNFLSDHRMSRFLLRAPYSVGATRINYVLSKPKFDRYEDVVEIFYNNCEIITEYPHLTTISKGTFKVIIGNNKKLVAWEIIINSCTETMDRELLDQTFSTPHGINGASDPLNNPFTLNDVESKFPGVIVDYLIDNRIVTKLEAFKATYKLKIPIIGHGATSVPLKDCFERVLESFKQSSGTNSFSVAPGGNKAPRVTPKSNKRGAENGQANSTNFSHNFQNPIPNTGTMMFNHTNMQQPMINGQFVNPNEVTSKRGRGGGGTRGTRRGRGQGGAKSRKQSTIKTPKGEGGQ
ncbi:hypothetical protein K502DRAFT_325066 [Neoconidiobolus thromboides FSU 785]|nr:hypothetical protein K502DRAFT_325066 [Neoconidiobolus thromboides FSU 785]